MSFIKEKLELFSGGGAGLQLYGYCSDDDTLADVQQSGYFTDAQDQLKVGDVLFVRASDGVAVTGVATSTTTAIDLYNFTSLSGSNTD